MKPESSQLKISLLEMHILMGVTCKRGTQFLLKKKFAYWYAPQGVNECVTVVFYVKNDCSDTIIIFILVKGKIIQTECFNTVGRQIAGRQISGRFSHTHIRVYITYSFHKSLSNYRPSSPNRIIHCTWLRNLNLCICQVPSLFKASH